MIKPFEFYVNAYNMVKNSRRHAAYRFTNESWQSLMRYRRYEIEDAVKAAKEIPKLELLKEWRHRDIICEDCKRRGWIGGAAMTSWICKLCRQGQTHGSTAVPQICKACAITTFTCQRCRESLDKDLTSAA